MRTLDFFALLLFLLSLHSTSRAQEASFFCAGHSAPGPLAGAAAKPLVDPHQPLPSQGRLHALVIFAQFKDEAHKPVPPFAEEIFAPQRPGSFTHFYTTMSFGQLQVAGTVLPKRYSSERPSSAYLSSAANERGDYGTFTAEILAQVEVDIGLQQFDNDGPDGMPNSGDDDGVVDYVFIVTRSIPANFLLGRATGIAGLNDVEYLSGATSPQGRTIKISGHRNHGAIFQEGTYSQIIGTMVHEFGHSLGLPDLYEWFYSADAPERDSAGIGKWGLMGWGAMGWHGDDGPNPFCAWSREQLGWIGADNRRLIEVADDTTGLEIAPLHAGGAIYKIPLDPEYLQLGTYADEYLLLEQRTRAASFYDRRLPGEGLLVWHVRSGYRDNSQEEKKLVDLVCADGRWADAGYRTGRLPDPQEGGDNLDFWAHQATYRTDHGGNDGDATDPFDGVRFTRLAPDTNPSSVRHSPSAAYTGLEIRMRRRGSRMEVDVRLPGWAGSIREKVRWLGNVRVDGDVEIAPEGALILFSGARIGFAGTDRTGAGNDPTRCELRVQGKLQIYPFGLKRQVMSEKHQIEARPVVFAGQQPGKTWTGILIEEGGSAQLPEDSFVIENALYGLVDDPAGLVAVPTVVTEATDAGGAPAEYTLLPNYPNPFTNRTILPYPLPVPAQVRLTIFNALGQRVRTLVDGKQSAGSHTAVWDGRSENGQNVASGVYLYHLEVAGKYAETRRMTLLR